MLDLSAYEGLAELLASDEIDGAFWLVEMDLPAGNAYFSETDIFEWDPGDGVHTWNPFLDPDAPIGGIKQSLSLAEKNDTTINLCNTSLAISALIRTVDVDGRLAKVYLYFPSIGQGLLLFRGVMGKPDALKEGVVSIPIVTMVHGPKVKIPSDACSICCRSTCSQKFQSRAMSCVTPRSTPSGSRKALSKTMSPSATKPRTTRPSSRPRPRSCRNSSAPTPTRRKRSRSRRNSTGRSSRERRRPASRPGKIFWQTPTPKAGL